MALSFKNIMSNDRCIDDLLGSAVWPTDAFSAKQKHPSIHSNDPQDTETGNNSTNVPLKTYKWDSAVETLHNGDGLFFIIIILVRFIPCADPNSFFLVCHRALLSKNK